MPTPSIVNPTGAFGAPVLGPGLLLDGGWYTEMIAGGAITAGQAVMTNSSSQVVVTTGTVSNVIGVALDTVASGQVCRVVTHGVVLGLCVAQSGGVSASTIYSSAASGAFTTASTTIGQNIVLAITTATATNTFNAFVQKM